MMKKALTVILLVLGLVTISSATLVTNMNQSVLYVRMLSRNASTDVDAVYYNPAGLVNLKNGWHLALHNQTVFQTKTVENDFLLLNNHTYDGKVSVPVFPDLYIAYKKDKLALSFGFGPSAGGGTADFEKGLPSFEWKFSVLPTLISGMGLPTTKYSADIAFKGSSVFYGFQVNAAYALSDAVSAAIGARYISARNTYEGHIQNVMVNPYHPLLNPTSAMIPATTFFTQVGQPVYAGMVADKTVDVAQTGSGFTPIISLNFKPAAGLNLAAKYEFNTKLELTNKTTKDDTGMFPDGEKSHSDIPAFLSVGAAYEITPQLRATASFNYFFDKNANWDGREKFVNSNSYDIGFGLEYDVTNCLALSAGYLATVFDLAADYQSDMSHDMGANTIGAGARIKMGPKLDVDLGVMLPMYKTDKKTIPYANFLTGAPIGNFEERYSRKTFAFAIGLNVHLGGE